MTLDAKSGHPLSRTVKYHYCKLVFRSILFLAALIQYLMYRLTDAYNTVFSSEKLPWILWVIWTIFVVEMIFRFFPSSIESTGCQKQFKKNFRPVSSCKETPKLQSKRSTLAVTAAWVGLNSIIGILYFTGMIDAGILFLISLAYSVCDMICILFFCPFQTWFMKNKCCTSCRIYNWDYAMMFTPLLFVWSFFTTTLVLISVIILIKWEILVHRHPERFLESHNACLSCGNCKEKLCHHKKQLRGFLKKNRAILQLGGNVLFQGKNELKKIVSKAKKTK